MYVSLYITYSIIYVLPPISRVFLLYRGGYVLLVEETGVVGENNGPLQILDT
jgi:hypothetical protein